MTDDRMGGIALIVGTVGTLVVMALHPTGHELAEAGSRFASIARLTAGVHGLAIALMPVSFLGGLALTRRLASPDRLAIMAVVFYGFAMVAGMGAAAVSGFVAPDLVARMVGAEASAAGGWDIALTMSGRLNQAFARILVAASSAAIVLWSAAMLRSRALGRSVAIYGLVVGPAIVGALLSGHLTLDVHGFGLVVVAQAIWLVTVGALLSKRGPAPAERGRAA
jgi:hypothetical protein